MPKTDLRIDLLGTSFSITVDEEASYLKILLDKYRRIIENTQKTIGLDDPLKTAIMAGFLLCEEVEKLRARENSGLAVHESMKAEEIICGLIDRFDRDLFRVERLGAS